jgi:type II secretory ATPase GspE/PulE/Tfp pilus assembly ATPase PilB-like protein
MSELGLPHTFQRGAGCDDCMKSGYKRRVGVYEVLPVDRHVRELVRRRASTEELAAAVAQRGFRTLYDNGLRLCSQGLTTLQEVQRVLGASD